MFIKILNIITFTCIAAINIQAQSHETESETILIGKITHQSLRNDSMFLWVNDSLAESINKPLANRLIDDSIRFLVFLGTWCSDSKNIIPEFIQYQRLRHIDSNRVVFYGLDKNKKGNDELPVQYHITRLPTIIAIKNDKELFRIVEYGRSGSWQTDFFRAL